MASWRFLQLKALAPSVLQHTRQSTSQIRNVFHCRLEGAVSSYRSTFQSCSQQDGAFGRLKQGRRLASTVPPVPGDHHQHIEQHANNTNFPEMDNAAALKQFRELAPEKEGRPAPSTAKLNVAIDDMLQRVPTFSSEQLTNALTLCLVHRFSRHHRLVQQLLRHIPRTLEDVSTHNLSLLVWSAAKLKVEDASLIATLAKKTIDHDWSTMNHHSLSRLLWAFTTLRHLPEPLLAAFLAHIPKHLPKCNIPSLTSWVWSAGMETTAIPNWFVQRLIDEVMKHPFSSWLYCTVAWTLGKRQQQDVQFYDAMFQRILRKEATKWTPRLISTMAWSLATSYLYNPDIMHRLAADAIPRLERFTNHDLANLVYAYGHLNHPSVELLEAVQALYIERVKGMGAAIIEDYTLGLTGLNTMWSCVVADFYPKRLVELFMDRQVLARIVEQRNVEAASALLQLHIALTTEHPSLGLTGLPPDVHESLIAISVQNSSQIHDNSKFHGYATQAMIHLTGSARGFHSEAHTRSSYRIDFELLVDQNGEPVIPPKGLWLTSSDLPTVTPTGAVDPSPVVRGEDSSSEGSTRDELELLRHTTRWARASSEVTTNGSHQRTNQRATTPPTLSSVALDSLIMNLEKRHSTGQAEGKVLSNGYPPQITQSAPDLPVVNLASDWSPTFTCGHVEGCHRVAIEADGPYHFHQSPEGYSLTGGTHLKRRQLAAMGWKVLPLPFHEWHALPSVKEQAEYIRQRLKKLVQDN